jgi:hypothetical protein
VFEPEPQPTQPKWMEQVVARHYASISAGGDWETQ